MQSPLKKLIATYAQPGRLSWIGLRPARRAFVQAVDTAIVQETGLAGDHGASEKRAVTLMQFEHLGAIADYLGRQDVSPEDLRRNLVVSGINLSALKGRRIQIGAAELEITGICAPCSRMEETLGQGGYSAVRGHGGWCARVITPGPIEIGDTVLPLTTQDASRSKDAV